MRCSVVSLDIHGGRHEVADHIFGSFGLMGNWRCRIRLVRLGRCAVCRCGVGH